jgi:hypothetical protein
MEDLEGKREDAVVEGAFRVNEKPDVYGKVLVKYAQKESVSHQIQRTHCGLENLSLSVYSLACRPVWG